MSIDKQIKDIVKKRQEKLKEIRKTLDGLEEMERQTENIEKLKDEMITREGEIIPGSRFEPILQENPDMILSLKNLDFKGVKSAISEARNAIKPYENRCDRKKVNISVVGMARIGKSELLNTLSGLTGKKVIPAFNTTDCTGASSIIYNEHGTELNARITFKTRKDMIEMAQTYVKRLVPNFEKRPVIRTMEQIKTINIDAITKLIPDGNADSVMLPYLKKLVEHYDEWSPYVGQLDIILTKEDDIMEFVAQNNGVAIGKPGRKEFFKYLAVSTCEIACSFPKEGMGDICLIDTVGLGDHTVGIEDDMLETVRDRSDAVIFVHMPVNGGGNGLPKPILDVYTQIKNACADRNLDKWLFYCINHVTNPGPSGVPAKNTAYVELALNGLQHSTLFGRQNAKAVDVMNSNEVINDFMMPLLESVTNNLDDIDMTYQKPAQEALNRVKTAYGHLCNAARKVLQSDLRNSAQLAPLLYKLTEDSHDKLRESLFKLMKKWKEKRDQPCEVVGKSTRAIFDRMLDECLTESYFPKLETIQSELASGAIPADVYIKYANSIRTKISNAFLNVDIELSDAIQGMKSELAHELIYTCGFGAVCAPPDKNVPEYTWLREFSENVFGENSCYSNLKLAFDTISEFELSVKGFLTYEIRSQLDNLDPVLMNVPPVNSNDHIEQRIAGNIYSCLYSEVSKIKTSLELIMRNLCIKPNRAMFAEIMDFYDRVMYSDGAKMAWNTFFSSYAAILWADEIKQQQTIGIVCKEWLDSAEALQKCNKSTAFVL